MTLGAKQFKSPALWIFLVTLVAAILVGMRTPPTWTVKQFALEVETDDKGSPFVVYNGEHRPLDEAIPLAESPLTVDKLSTLHAAGDQPKSTEKFVYESVEEGGEQKKRYFQQSAHRHWGFWSFLPALTAILLCWMTKEPIYSLFAGIVVGAALIGQFNVLDGILIPSIGTPSAATILILYLWLLGGLMGVWAKTGASEAFADYMSAHFVRGPRSAKLVAWLLGVIFFQGGTISAVLVGTTVRPLADEEHVIHIQNYHVTPATGKVRDFVIRRLLHQSASNGIRFKVSGGHGVIESTQSTADDMQSAAPINLPQKYPETGLRRLPIYWYQVPFALQTTRDKRSYRFGRDILLLGDFEQHRLFGLVDTDWQFNRDDSGVTDTFSHEGRYALKIAPPVSPDASVARQKYFLRFIDATPSSSMSLTGYAKSTGAARLSVCLDLWPSKWGRTQAIRNPQEKCLKTIDVAKDEWQQFDVDFGPLGTSLKGFRVCLKNERNDHAAESTILVDDLALIIWETKEQPRKDGLDRRISNRHNYLYLENGGQPNSPSVLKVTDLTTPRPAR